MLKVFCSETAIKAAEEPMRIHSVAGYLAESVVGRIYRRQQLRTGKQLIVELHLKYVLTGLIVFGAASP